MLKNRDSDHSEDAFQGASIAIAGGGNIGVAFAIVFASAGFDVRVFEPDRRQRKRIPVRVSLILADLQSFDLLPVSPKKISARVSVTGDLAKALAGVTYVQECAPENRDAKAALFCELDRLASDEVILASSSSALPVSEFTTQLPGRQRCLVAHPGNPPFLLRVIEIVPAPYTNTDVVAHARRLLEYAGLAPILVRKEIKGFIFNRLQGAVLREAYCLVRDGVASVEDIDRLMRDGLGLRWAVTGPFETVDLNTAGGIARHAERLGAAYAEMGAERGQADPWTPDLVSEVVSQRRDRLPLSQWEDRVRWRDRSLMALLDTRRKTIG